MGIDIYMRWNGQTEEERSAQFTGFSIVHGHVGYLRESYSAGGPKATKVLVPEAFEDDSPEGVPIPASVLRDRLSAALNATDIRYAGASIVVDAKKSLVDFVELAERKEKETRGPVRIYASY